MGPRLPDERVVQVRPWPLHPGHFIDNPWPGPNLPGNGFVQRLERHVAHLSPGFALGRQGRGQPVQGPKGGQYPVDLLLVVPRGFARRKRQPAEVSPTDTSLCTVEAEHAQVLGRQLLLGVQDQQELGQVVPPGAIPLGLLCPFRLIPSTGHPLRMPAGDVDG